MSSTGASHRVSARGEIDLVMGHVQSAFDLAQPFPNWTFRSRTAHAVFLSFYMPLKPEFWPFLRSLASIYGDDVVELVMLEPTPFEIYDECGDYGAVQLSTSISADGYRTALAMTPSPSKICSIDTAGVWVACGASTEWGLWNDYAHDLSVAYCAPRAALSDWLETVSEHTVSFEQAIEIISMEVRDERRLQSIASFRQQFAA